MTSTINWEKLEVEKISQDSTNSMISGCNRNPNGNSKKEIMSMISRHASFSFKLKREIQEHPESFLQSSGSIFAKKINGMIREIFREMDRQRQFTRTSLSSNGILIGKVQFKHHIEDMVLDYFHTRFPQFIICLFNEIKNETIIINENGAMFRSRKNFQEIIDIMSKSRPISDIYSKIDVSTEKLFNEFYSSQFIKARENRRYFRHMIPKKVMKHPGMRGGVESRYQNLSIDQFLTQKKKK